MPTPSSFGSADDAPAGFGDDSNTVVAARLRHGIGVRRWAIADAVTRRAGLIAVCVLAALLGGVGLGDENHVSLHGDMPKFLMNGTFLLDMARDRPFSSLAEVVDYAEHYYARYPALSLGHHPPLLPLLEAPMFALAGVSVTSARLVLLISLVIAVGLLYRLVDDIYGRLPAFAAAVFFATSPPVVMLGRSVLAETLTLALVMGSAYCLHRFCEAGRRSALVGFVVCATLSLYAKQLAVFVFPAFLLMAVTRLGVRRLFQRDLLVAAGVIVLLAMPLVPITFVLSQTNIGVVQQGLGDSRISYLTIVRQALDQQFAMPVLLLAAAGVVRAVVTRDRRSLLFVFWSGSVLAGLLIAGVYEPARYSIYWVPALCALAASAMAGLASGGRTRVAVVAVLLAAVVFQGRAAARVALPGAGGYEEVARFVLASAPGPTVLFSGDIDTGFFTFFIRKHDPARRLVVLRSDKVLTTSRMDLPSIEDRIDRPEQIYDVLRNFGTRFVVLEDRPSPSQVMNWLRAETRTSRFVERRRVPIGTTDPRLGGVDLVVYEFLGATPPAADAVLSMRMPLVSRSVAIKLTDLTGGGK